MHQGQLIFSQLMRHLPLTTFRRCMAHYAGEHKVKSFSCLDQYLSMAFAQLIFREHLRDIESSLRAQAAKLYHLEIRGNVWGVNSQIIARTVRHDQSCAAGHPW